MSIGTIVNVMRSGIFQIFILILPVLSAALIIGLIVAIFQATTSIQEQTLTFLPKLIVILLVLALLSGWMFSELRDYTVKLFEIIPELAK
ncbi:MULTISPECIES: flagellar biosynthesis protein FliQ [Treponema]|uniref:flagellar biosynthesis protein FliQ n=1 Tax=Treponema TaxID=157 RepID=UPI002352BF8D|nr:MULTISPECIES: flagellar biosynthesis protein FliQ [Treponema]MCI5645759.1 flagellar biosynthesis protein FliQ [Treponema porcinum]MCI6481592.1 flagellar biosynthesis protein FliQ [Treponema porcinum]MDD7127126.1 flagellar biosynthesis protein FliQ [Treponema porcinum]MDY4467921.1 flagellar biosynthesis protein FliQ [Treponema porcinum]MDY5120869.1 flagellar biosynthesis protein FliQ [Treponema porcinum]